MAKKPESTANTTKAADRNGGKTKRAVIKDLEPNAKAAQKVVGGISRLGLTTCP